MLTRNPVPTSDDFAGFPVMHFADPISCVPISVCYPNAAVPKMDDITALARLYPPAGNPQPAGRVCGSVYFTDSSGNAMQQMQGVNVVARLMVLGPALAAVCRHISFRILFRRQRRATSLLDTWMPTVCALTVLGRAIPSLEGFYDLGQLMIPTGQTIAQYQLSVEALDANWSLGR